MTVVHALFIPPPKKNPPRYDFLVQNHTIPKKKKKNFWNKQSISVKLKVLYYTQRLSKAQTLFFKL